MGQPAAASPRGDDEVASNETTVAGEGDHREKEEEMGKATGESEPPVFEEGGWMGWLQVVGAFLVLFCTFGLSNAFGVLQVSLRSLKDSLPSFTTPYIVHNELQ